MFDELDTLTGLSKEDFREMRKRKFYDLPSNSGNLHFPRNEMILFKEEIYDVLAEKKRVCPQQPLNMAFLSRNEYFSEAIWVARKMGLERLMVEQQDYDIPIIHQFFATVVFDNDDLRSFQWMTGPVSYRSNFREFGELLGYGYAGAEIESGTRMHVAGVDPDKGKLLPLYGSRGVPGKARYLKQLYNILLRMFRENIAPQAGNLDDIRGGLVNLMYHAHQTYLEGPEAENRAVDVMDFIHSELVHAILEKKTPIYEIGRAHV